MEIGTDVAIEQHLRGCDVLIRSYAEKLRATDSEAFRGLCAALAAGASYRLTTNLSKAGLCEMSLDLVMLDGEIANLGHIEFGNSNDSCRQH